MGAITTHILDTARGQPAAGVPVRLEVHSATQGWKVLATGHTDSDGRVKNFLPSGERLEPGTYRLTFDAAQYFRGHGLEAFFPEVSLVFRVRDAAEHYHVPLLLSPYGYTTYRGS
ncbi:MAG TPA: hydroxyisourate hydrolase [Candidatus Acidoferrales bacterium]|nr:hydroxyisourate hydrolase [Candidatus Acidoferrales bacterium]